MIKPTVLVIGASRGIGLGLVSKYVVEGWDVHGTIRKQSDISALPQGITWHILDVTNSEQIGTIAAAFVDRPIDLLIHNAGVGKSMPEDVIMNVNVQAPFEVISAVFPAVQASRQKKIAIISSQLGSREKYGAGNVPRNPYGASKCLLNDRFRLEEVGWRALGVSGLVVHPGWVVTDMGGPGADITVDESVSGMYGVFNNLSFDNSGSFVTYTGETHPW